MNKKRYYLVQCIGRDANMPVKRPVYVKADLLDYFLAMAEQHNYDVKLLGHI